MSEVLLNSLYALCDFDKYFLVLSLVRSKTMFDSTFQIIGSKVTAPFDLLSYLVY